MGAQSSAPPEARCLRTRASFASSRRGLTFVSSASRIGNQYREPLNTSRLNSNRPESVENHGWDRIIRLRKLDAIVFNRGIRAIRRNTDRRLLDRHVFRSRSYKAFLMPHALKRELMCSARSSLVS